MEPELAILDSVLHDFILEKGQINQAAVSKANEGVLRTPAGAFRAVSTIKALLVEDAAQGIRKYHVLKNYFVNKVPVELVEDHRYELIRKLIFDLTARLESTNYSDAKMLFMESMATAMESKSSAFKASPPAKNSTLRKMFSSSEKDKGTRKELDYNLRHGKGLLVDCSLYSPAMIAEEILKLLEESAPLLCEEDKAVFNKYVFVQAKTEGWEKVRGFITLVSALPEMNQVLLKELFKLLNLVWNHVDATGMDDEMLAFSLAPRLLRPERATKVESVMNSRAFVQGAVLAVLRNSDIICRAPSIVLSQATFDWMQKIVNNLAETFFPLLSSPNCPRETILAVEELLHITECVRVTKMVAKVDKKYPFLTYDSKLLPMSFWISLAAIRKGQNSLDTATSLMTLLHLANFEDEYNKAVERELVQQLQITEMDLEDVISVQKPATKLKPPAGGAAGGGGEDLRRSTMATQARVVKALCSAGNCEQYPLTSLNTKYCRYHFEEYRTKEDPSKQQRVRGKKPGRNCDVFTTLPAVIFDVDLGFKLSGCASYFIHTNPNYRDNLVYDIKCFTEDNDEVGIANAHSPKTQAANDNDDDDDDIPPPPSGPPPMAEWSLERMRRAPPPLSGINNGTVELNMTEAEAADFALKAVRNTTEDPQERELQPPAQLNMAQPHLKIVWEIITTEEAYVKILKYVADHFVSKLRAGGSNGLTLDEVDLLFRNIARLSNLHTKLLSDLYRRFCTWTDDVETQRIGDILVNFDESFRVYPTYVNKHDEALDLLYRVNSNTSKYAKFIQMQRDARELPISQNRDLASCLISPIQRIPRYRLLVQELLKQYSKSIPNHPDIESLEQALQIIIVYANQVNEQLRRSEQERDMLALKDELTGTEKHGQLVTGARYLIHRGNLMRVCRKSVRVYHFFLFNDLLLYSTKNPSQPGRGATYGVQKWIPIDETFSITPSQEGRWQVRSKVKSFEIFPEDPTKYAQWNEKFLALTQQGAGGEGSAEAAPVWEPDSHTADCPGCFRKFTVVRRRHHCRDCGNVVCGQCSSHKLVLSTSNDKPVRVCDRCYDHRSNNSNNSNNHYNNPNSNSTDDEPSLLSLPAMTNEKRRSSSRISTSYNSPPPPASSSSSSSSSASPASRRSSLKTMLTVLKFDQKRSSSIGSPSGSMDR